MKILFAISMGENSLF